MLNPMTQKMEWKNQPEDYDYQQEVARAAFADMLHDDERVMMGQYTVYYKNSMGKDKRIEFNQ